MNGLTILVKMDYVGIPQKEAFHSSLKQEAASKEDQYHVLNVYDTLKCLNWIDYTLAFFTFDVLLLSDVFEHFRNMYKLGSIGPC